MTQSNRYLDSVSIVDDDGIETVTINEALIACQIQELESLTSYFENKILGTQEEVFKNRMAKLEKILHNIKIK